VNIITVPTIVETGISSPIVILTPVIDVTPVVDVVPILDTLVIVEKEKGKSFKIIKEKYS